MMENSHLANELWSRFGSEIVGQETEQIFRVHEGTQLVLCNKAEIVSFTLTRKDPTSSQTKLWKVTVSYEGFDRTGKPYCAIKRRYNIDDIWFYNRKTLTKAARMLGMEMSAWCHLLQEEAYLQYEFEHRPIDVDFEATPYDLRGHCCCALKIHPHEIAVNFCILY